jgi:protein involved in polysaccharide export with SLBB domain
MKHLIFIIFFCTVSFGQTTERITTNNAPTTISVTIAGHFPVTGSFVAGFSERVDQFVTRIYNQSLAQAIGTVNDERLLQKIKKEFADYSLRGLKLKRSDGSNLNIDLQKFRINGDFINNPYLKNDDVIIFPPNDIERNFITISGAVNVPGTFLFVEGDKLSDIIELAHGLNPAFELTGKVKVSRLSYDGKTQKIINVDLHSDFYLQRGDQVVVLADETQKKQFFALVLGEVNQPGYVPITKNNTKLGDLLKQTNGFTSNAALSRAKIFRGNSITNLLEKQYGIRIDEKLLDDNSVLVDRIVNFEQQMMFRMSNLVEEDQGYFAAENQYRVLNEGSAVDFTKIFDENSEIYNFIVHPGDVIIIPQKTNTVYVFGQVSNPGHVKYSQGKNYEYYIEQAGGVGEYAEDEIMIIKGSSRNWVIAKDNIIIEEGDFIFVPKERLKSFRTFAMELSGYFSIIGSIATVLLLIFQFSK